MSDIQGALAEIGRVLSPTGRYLLLEHGLADDTKVQKWQRRLTPFNSAVFGGCRLDRPTSELMTEAGFRFESVKRFYMVDTQRFAGFMTLGSAAPS